jgi:hypothetical protein
MLAAIPHQSGYAVTFGEACALQSGCQSERTPVKIAIGVTVARTVGAGRDDLHA